MLYSFTLDFVPTKRRPRFTRRGMAYDPPENAREARLIRAALKSQCPDARAAEGGVRVEVDVFRALPKSKPKKVKSEQDLCKPDADNIAKAILDALNGVAWRDDAQVWSLGVRKNPRTRRDHDSVLIRVY